MKNITYLPHSMFSAYQQEQIDSIVGVLLFIAEMETKYLEYTYYILEDDSYMIWLNMFASKLNKSINILGVK